MLIIEITDISGLEGRILAVVTREYVFSTNHFVYLKRPGKQMPGAPSIY